MNSSVGRRFLMVAPIARHLNHFSFSLLLLYLSFFVLSLPPMEDLRPGAIREHERCDRDGFVKERLLTFSLPFASTIENQKSKFLQSIK